MERVPMGQGTGAEQGQDQVMFCSTGEQDMPTDESQESRPKGNTAVMSNPVMNVWECPQWQRRAEGKAGSRSRSSMAGQSHVQVGWTPADLQHSSDRSQTPLSRAYIGPLGQGMNGARWGCWGSWGLEVHIRTWKLFSFHTTSFLNFFSILNTLVEYSCI